MKQVVLHNRLNFTSVSISRSLWSIGGMTLLLTLLLKQTDSILPSVCSVINYRSSQNVVRTSVTRSLNGSCTTFLFLLYFDAICNILLNRSTATWNLFVKLF